jgi:hypothetical protein
LILLLTIVMAIGFGYWLLLMVIDYYYGYWLLLMAIDFLAIGYFDVWFLELGFSKVKY